jgi:hypothetical protein
MWLGSGRPLDHLLGSGRLRGRVLKAVPCLQQTRGGGAKRRRDYEEGECRHRHAARALEAQVGESRQHRGSFRAVRPITPLQQQAAE